MRKALQLAGGGLVILGLSVLLVWAYLASRGEQVKERELEKPIAAPQRTSRGLGGETVVTLDSATQRRIGLNVEALAAATLRPEIVALGTLQEDPSRSFTVRAPVAGVVRRTEPSWPDLGAVLTNGAVVGAIEPHVSPVAQIDLRSQLAAAQADEAALVAALTVARAAFDRAKILNAEGKIVSDRALQEAEATMKGEEARLNAAREKARLVGASLTSAAGPTGPIPLRLEQGGEVVEVFVQPGEVVQSGQSILRVARFDTLVVKVDLPVGERVDRSIATARIILIGQEDRPLRGHRIAQSAADPRTRGLSFLFRVGADGLVLRPGEAVTAYLPVPGERRTGVVIPRSAIVRFSDRAWAYVAIEPEKFSRREVTLDNPTEAGWFVASGFAVGERIVTAAVQMLLSEELKSQIRIAD